MSEKHAAIEELRAFLLERLHTLETDTVVAVVGLIGSVIHADGVVELSELGAVRKELSRLPILGNAEINKIVQVLPRVRAAVDTEVHAWTRALKDSTTNSTRYDIVDILVQIAASDGVIRLNETNMMRRLVGLLGLSQDDYDTLQQKHRDKLALLFDAPSA